MASASTSAASSPLITALSADGSLVAVVAAAAAAAGGDTANIRILIYHVATCQLQATLMYRRPAGTGVMAATASSQKDPNASSSYEMKKLLFVGNTRVVGFVSRTTANTSSSTSNADAVEPDNDDSICVWDLTRGVMAYCLPAINQSDVEDGDDGDAAKKKKRHSKKKKRKQSHDDQRYLDIASSSPNMADSSASGHTLAILLYQKSKDKVVIHECDVRSGQLIRKVRVAGGIGGGVRPLLGLATRGQNKNAAVAAAAALVTLSVTDRYFIVRLPRDTKDSAMIRVVDRATGDKVTKITLPSPSTIMACTDNMIITNQFPSTGQQQQQQQQQQHLFLHALPSGAQHRVDEEHVIPQHVINSVVVKASSTGDDSSAVQVMTVREKTQEPDTSFILLLAERYLYSLEKKGDDDRDESNKTLYDARLISELRQDNTSSTAMIEQGKVMLLRQPALQQQQRIKKKTQDVRVDVAVVLKSPTGQYQVQTVAITGPAPNDDEAGKRTSIEWKQDDIVGVNNNGNKRKLLSEQQEHNATAATKSPAAVLGPTHSGGEAQTTTDAASSSSTKKLKTSNQQEDEKGDDGDGDDDSEDGDGDDEGIAIGERLKQIRKALDEEEQEQLDERREERSTAIAALGDFQPKKKVTTESLVSLVKQALQSNDDAMLELALTVRDTNVIKTTCEQLFRGEGDEEGDGGTREKKNYFAVLLTAITTRITYKPVRADQLAIWISTILSLIVSTQSRNQLLQQQQHQHQGHQQLANNNNLNYVELLQQLQVLRNLLQERVELFPSLLKLDGRLTMMT